MGGECVAISVAFIRPDFFLEKGCKMAKIRTKKQRGAAVAACVGRRADPVAGGGAMSRQFLCGGCAYVLIHRCMGCGAPICAMTQADMERKNTHRGFGGNGQCRLLPHKNRGMGAVCMTCAERFENGIL